jgi:uncharacterized protein YndB with AHSA1/START domain
MTVSEAADVPVRRTVTVRASVDRAFSVFTDGFDTWWPKSHNIGPAPLERSVIESHVGGRCYSHCTDGADYPWATVLVWEPPHRFVVAWQISPEWKYEPDLAKSSEVEVTFTAEAAGTTRVDLEHRRFDRYADGGVAMRKGVEGPQGWSDLLRIFTEKINEQTA